jgi:hypothetical protein
MTPARTPKVRAARALARQATGHGDDRKTYDSGG